jgi:hypothetical protein
MTAGDEGRAAARRAEIRKTILQIIDRNGSEPMILLERVLTVVDPLLAECDRRSRAVEALKPYVLHRATCEIVTEPHPRVNFCTCGLDEALASRAPAADKEPS